MRKALILATMLLGFGCVPPPPPGGGTGGAGGGPAPTCEGLAQAVIATSTAPQTCASDADCTYVNDSCVNVNGMSQGSPYLNQASAAKVVSLNAQRHAAQCGDICYAGNNPHAYCAPSQVCRPREESEACKTMASAISQEIDANKCNGSKECTEVVTNWNLPYVCGVCLKSSIVDKLKPEFHQYALMGCGDEDPTPPCPQQPPCP